MFLQNNSNRSISLNNEQWEHFIPFFNMMISKFSSQKRGLRAVILVLEKKPFSHWCIPDWAALPVSVPMWVHGDGDCVHG